MEPARDIDARRDQPRSPWGEEPMARESSETNLAPASAQATASVDLPDPLSPVMNTPSSGRDGSGATRAPCPSRSPSRRRIAGMTTDSASRNAGPVPSPHAAASLPRLLIQATHEAVSTPLQSPLSNQGAPDWPRRQDASAAVSERTHQSAGGCGAAGSSAGEGQPIETGPIRCIT